MSIPLGGFYFAVGLDTKAAQQNMAQLVAAVQAGTQSVQAAFAAAQPQLNLGPVLQQLNAFQQQTRQLQQQAQIRVNVTADGASEAGRNLDGLLRQVNFLAARSQINLSVRAQGAQAEAEIRKMQQLLRRSGTGDTINYTLRANASQIESTLQRLDREFRAAEARGVNIKLNLDTTEAQSKTRAFGGVLQGLVRGGIAGSGLGGSLLIGAGLGGGAALALGAAVVAQKLTEAMTEGISAGIQYNASLETVTQTMTQLTGSATAAAVVISRLRQYADVTPFGTAETLEVGRQFAITLNGNVDAIERYVKYAGQLAAVSPGKTLGDAARAIQELRGGQIETLAEVFNIPRSVINGVLALGLSFEDTLKKIIAFRGGSEELVRQLGETFAGRLSTAQSNLAEFGRIAAQPLFEKLSVALRDLNKDFEQNRGGWENLARTIGAAVGEMGAAIIRSIQDFKTFITESQVLFQFLENISKGQGFQEASRSARTDVQRRTEEKPQLTAADQAAQAVSAEKARQVDEVTRKLGQNKQELDNINKAETAIAAIVADINHKTAERLAPLERQTRELEQQILLERANVVRADQQIRQAGPPPEVLAEVDASRVLIQHEREIVEIRQARRKVVQDIADAEAAAAAHAADVAIQAQRRVLEDTQRESSLNQQVRRDAIQDLRNESEVRKQVRDDALAGLRDIIQARQEERQAAIDGLRQESEERKRVRDDALADLREQIQTRRDAFDLERDQSRERAEDSERAFQDRAHAQDIAHRRSQDALREQIERLQRQDQESRRSETTGKTQAEVELEALEKQHRERERIVSLAHAERSVLEAHTGKERRDALDRLHELREQQSFERAREAKQEQIERAKEEREKKSTAIQEKIANLTAKAQDQDRKYQREKEDRDEKHRQEVEAQQASDRQRDRAERELRRKEDADLKDRERANRDADKADAATIRLAERADRDARRQEEAQVRAQEQSNRDADRADQARIKEEEKRDRDQTRREEADIRTAQLELLQAQRGQEDTANALQAGADDRRLRDLREVAGLTNDELANRQRLVDATNSQTQAQATYNKRLAEERAKDLDYNRTLIGLQIEGIRKEGEIAAAPFELVRSRLEASEYWSRLTKGNLEDVKQALETSIAPASKDTADALERAADAAERIKQAANTTDVPGGGAAPEPSGFSLGGGFDPVGMGNRAGRSFRESFLNWLNGVSGDVQAEFASAGRELEGIDWLNPNFWLTVGGVAIEGILSGFANPAHAQDLGEGFDAIADEVNFGDRLATSAEDSINEQQSRITGAMIGPFAGAFSPDSPEGAAVFQAAAQFALTLSDTLGNTWVAADLAARLEAPFIEFTDQYLRSMIDQKMGPMGKEAAETFANEFDRIDLAHRIEEPFIEVTDRYFPVMIGKYERAGSDAADAFVEGFALGPPPLEVRLVSVLDQVITLIGNRNRSFFDAGQNAGQSWCNGWETAMAGCQCSTCTGGAGASITGGGGGGGGVSQPTRDQITVGEIFDALRDCAPRREQNGTVYVLVRDQWVQALPVGSPNDPNPECESRAQGGPMMRGGNYRLHPDEIVMTAPSAGTVLPASVLRGIERMSELGGDTPSSSGGGGGTAMRQFGDVKTSVNLNVYAQAGENVEQIAQRTAELIGPELMGSFIEALTQIEQDTPKRSKRTLGGGL